MATLHRALIRRATWWVLPWWFLMNCASSKSTTAQSNSSNASNCNRNSVYEVTTIRAAPICSSIGPSVRTDATAAALADGRNFAASRTQFPTTLVGAITRNRSAGSSSSALAISDNACTVLPNPMSSARIPPIWLSHKNFNQLNPSIW